MKSGWKLINCLLLSCLSLVIRANEHKSDSIDASKSRDAIAFISGMRGIEPSKYWPNVQPDEFLSNLEHDVQFPFSIYEGKVTNFCSYAALTYIPYHYDPLGFVQFMVQLYKEGKAKLGETFFNPGEPVRNIAGTLRNKGILDISPANQVWFLALADRFKGYLNIFNKKFDPGDENKLWAATNYSKFNRMIRQLFNMNVKARGADLLRPSVNDMVSYLQERLKTGTLFLYVNNRKLYKIKHTAVSRFDIPTHFLVLLQMKEVNGKYRLTYWDYGCISVQELSPEFIKKITFGVSHCTLR